jgi:hypothetical protein
MHYEEFNNLYSSPNITRMTKLRRVRYAGHIASIGERRNPRMKDNIKMDFRETG